jgi:tetratricopeptide (TPR) repeat protein
LIANARAAEHQGDLARGRNNYATASFYYLKALRNDPENSQLLNKLAVSEFKEGNKGAARKHLGQAIKYDPRNVVAFNNLGALDLVDRKYKSALHNLKQALALDETNATAHLNIAEAWVGLAEIDRAMTEYTRALELDSDILTSSNGVVAQVSTPEQRARVSYLIAKSYAKRGNLDGALEYLQRAKDGHYAEMARVYMDQEFAPLWNDVRLQKIVKR